MGSHLQPCHGPRVTSHGPTNSNTSHKNTAKTKKIYKSSPPVIRHRVIKSQFQLCSRLLPSFLSSFFAQMRKMSAKRGGGARMASCGAWHGHFLSQEQGWWARPGRHRAGNHLGALGFGLQAAPSLVPSGPELSLMEE